MQSEGLVAQEYELKRLNFEILQLEPEAIVARRRSFYWDCGFCFINYIVFVRKVPTLSAQIIESDRPRFLTISKNLNPSALPKGLQSGNAILVIYIADYVDAEAQVACEGNIKLEFAQFYIPSALDLSREATFLVRRDPYWGRVFYGKFRYILKRLLLPHHEPTKEPLSILGISLPLIYVFFLFLILRR
jgi:hypothetical protein